MVEKGAILVSRPPFIALPCRVIVGLRESSSHGPPVMRFDYRESGGVIHHNVLEKSLI